MELEVVKGSAGDCDVQRPASDLFRHTKAVSLARCLLGAVLERHLMIDRLQTLNATSQFIHVEASLSEVENVLLKRGRGCLV